MSFDPLFDKVPPKGGHKRNSAVAGLADTTGTATVAAPADIVPNSPFDGKPMTPAKVGGVPVFVDLSARAVYPVQL